jgi:pimeloyl-ACP methyl ester carboxylesterase
MSAAPKLTPDQFEEPAKAGRDSLPLVAIVGPTASGKSSLAVALARKLKGDVLACDSTQVYRGFDIGTSKPTLEERGGVPHHLMDLVDPSFPFTAGAYDNLGRVVRFLATSQAEFPDGRMEPYAAHDYGAAVFVYSHLEQFFPASDLAVAHDSLRDWLWERPSDAQTLYPRLSPPGRATMEILLARQIDRLRPKLLDAIQADDSQLSAISPEGKLAALHTPVFILHGATDDIIPSTESLWLEKDIPKPYVRAALITPAFSHVDPDKHAVWVDQLRLVEFLAGVLRTAD